MLKIHLYYLGAIKTNSISYIITIISVFLCCLVTISVLIIMGYTFKYFLIFLTYFIVFILSNMRFITCFIVCNYFLYSYFCMYAILHIEKHNDCSFIYFIIFSYFKFLHSLCYKLYDFFYHYTYREKGLHSLYTFPIFVLLFLLFILAQGLKEDTFGNNWDLVELPKPKYFKSLITAYHNGYGGQVFGPNGPSGPSGPSKMIVPLPDDPENRIGLLKWPGRYSVYNTDSFYGTRFRSHNQWNYDEFTWKGRTCVFGVDHAHYKLARLAAEQHTDPQIIAFKTHILKELVALRFVDNSMYIFHRGYIFFPDKSLVSHLPPLPSLKSEGTAPLPPIVGATPFAGVTTLPPLSEELGKYIPKSN